LKHVGGDIIGIDCDLRIYLPSEYGLKLAGDGISISENEA